MLEQANDNRKRIVLFRRVGIILLHLILNRSQYGEHMMTQKADETLLLQTATQLMTQEE